VRNFHVVGAVNSPRPLRLTKEKGVNLASLFGTHRLREVASQLDTEPLLPKIAIVQEWLDDLLRGTLRTDNETGREQQFNQDFFKTILGYVERPAQPHTFQPKASTESGEIPDARIGFFDSNADIDETIAVVELKGTTTNLDRPQRRSKNESAVQQGFRYKTQYRRCSFVIVSNFAEIRLYNDNQLDFESWTLQDLVDRRHDFARFKAFYWLLNADNLPRLNGYSKTEALLSDIRVSQDEVGAKFYREYSAARLNLLKSLHQNNEVVRGDLELGIAKAQKIIDRVVFAAFAEDRGLLPDNTLQRVLETSRGVPVSTWSIVKAFFDGIDRGDAALGIPMGYNGGLFARDPELDDLIIEDSEMEGVLAFGNTRFDEDLSVTVLGHIFEQSISDLGTLRSQIDSGDGIEALADSRRRDDGIYYTPEHMVRFIVDRSLGEYLRANEQRILDEFGLRDEIQEKTYARRERDAYLSYREFLLAVRVLDPAAGSGAFLVQVFDVLMAEHLRVAAILDNDIFSNAEFAAHILRSNVFGVDLNEESVEITKLSLWLKSATKGTKLVGLEDHVKVGNSLAPGFKWAEAFPEVLESGGFDIIVGNPPYVKERTNRKAFDGLHANDVYQGKMDLWYLFGSIALDLVKPETGRIAFIATNNWITNAGGAKFRDKVLDKGRILEYFDFNDHMVFEEAGVQTMVYVMARSDDRKSYYFPYSRLLVDDLPPEEFARVLQGVESDAVLRFQARIDPEALMGETFHFNDSMIEMLLDSISAAGTTSLKSDEVATGIDVHQDYLNSAGFRKLGGTVPQGSGIFNLSLAEYDQLELSALERAYVKPFYTTEQLGRYSADPEHSAWVIYTDSKFKSVDSMNTMPNLKAHLDRFPKVITSDNAPYGLHRARQERFFQGEKIISLRKAERPTFTYTDFDCYVSQTYFVIQSARWNHLALTAILNSTLIAFWLKFRGKMQGSHFQVDKQPLVKMPLIIPVESDRLAELAKANISARDSLRGVELALQAVLSPAANWVRANPRWWGQSAEDVLTALPLIYRLNNRDAVLPLIKEHRRVARELELQIRDIENEIDSIVFTEYGITDSAVGVIRSALAELRKVI